LTARFISCIAFRSLSSGDDFNDFKPVARLEAAGRELGRGDRLAVMLDHDTARQEPLRHQESFQRARQFGLEFLSVGDDNALPRSARLRLLRGTRRTHGKI
jgi:hypothetical protein